MRCRNVVKYFAGFLLLLVCLLSNCSKQDKNVKDSINENNKTENIQESVGKEKNKKSDAELLLDKLLLEAYVNNDYVKCLEILQEGSDGRVDYLKPDYPLLFDICQKYLDKTKRSPEIETLFDFYLKNRKAAFEDSIEGVYPTQTVGSYLSRFATVELLRLLVQEEININSPGEKKIRSDLLFDLGTDETNMHSAIYELSWICEGNPFHSKIYKMAVLNKELVIKAEEKKIRMELLLDAGADVTAVNSVFDATMFHYFNWYPFEEDYTELLDRMIEKGADLLKKSQNDYSCIFYAVNGFALKKNTEAYLEYVISRGLHATRDDLYEFASYWFTYMRGDKVTETELRRLEKIKRILEEDVKLTIVPYINPYADREGFELK
jgi:hypothetical protein